MAPEISVIIPVYNDPDGLKDTVLSLINQDYKDEKYEIIIADNGSTDDTFRVAESFSKAHPDLIKVVLENKVQTSYAARNKAVEVSKGDLLCFLDADMTTEPDYLKQVKASLDEKTVDYIGCNVHIYSDTETLSSKFNTMNGFPVESFLKNSHFVPTCCLSIKRSVILKVGNFDSRLESSGDFEFGNRVYEAGLGQKYVDSIVVRHPARWRYRHLSNKSRRIGRGIAQLNYYYSGKYKHCFRGFYDYRGYMPSNPIKLYRRYKKKQIPIGPYSSFIISFFPLILNLTTYFSIIKEEKRLKKLDPPR